MKFPDDKKSKKIIIFLSISLYISILISATSPFITYSLIRQKELKSPIVWAFLNKARPLLMMFLVDFSFLLGDFKRIYFSPMGCDIRSLSLKFTGELIVLIFYLFQTKSMGVLGVIFTSLSIVLTIFLFVFKIRKRVNKDKNE